MVSFQPVVKWTGSKRSQAEEILKYFPQEMDVYYEPFCGGCSMLRYLLDNRNLVKVNKFECSDYNADLIALWNCIKNNPKEVYKHYKNLWTELNSTDDFEKKKEYFNKIRARYNEKRDPLDFCFILRTTTMGMPRYAKEIIIKDGVEYQNFNNSFHVTRNGINPETLKEIIDEWSEVLNMNDVHFIHRSYDTIRPTEKDFVYMDPPYAGTKGIYFSNFNTQHLFKFIRELKAPYVMSYDGISGNVDNTYAVPEDLYDEHKYIKSGNSSFKRTIGKSSDSIVYESLYIKNVKNPVNDYYSNKLF